GVEMMEEAPLRQPRGLADVLDPGRGVPLGSDHVHGSLEKPGLRFVGYGRLGHRPVLGLRDTSQHLKYTNWLVCCQAQDCSRLGEARIGAPMVDLAAG